MMQTNSPASIVRLTSSISVTGTSPSGRPRSAGKRLALGPAARRAHVAPPQDVDRVHAAGALGRQVGRSQAGSQREGAGQRELLGAPPDRQVHDLGDARRPQHNLRQGVHQPGAGQQARHAADVPMIRPFEQEDRAHIARVKAHRLEDRDVARLLDDDGRQRVVDAERGHHQDRRHDAVHDDVAHQQQAQDVLRGLDPGHRLVARSRSRSARPRRARRRRRPAG